MAPPAAGFLLGTPAEKQLAGVAAGCASVVVCRASPSQKAAVVRMMMEYEVILNPELHTPELCHFVLRLPQPEGRRRAHDDGVRGDTGFAICTVASSEYRSAIVHHQTTPEKGCSYQESHCDNIYRVTAITSTGRSARTKARWLAKRNLSMAMTPLQIDTAQAGRRGPFSRWLARYKRRMDYKMLAIGDGEQLLRWHLTEAPSDNICRAPPPNGASHTTS